MGSVAHIKDEKKELVHDVYKLTHFGVRSVDSKDGRVVIHTIQNSLL